MKTQTYILSSFPVSSTIMKNAQITLTQAANSPTPGTSDSKTESTFLIYKKIQSLSSIRLSVKNSLFFQYLMPSDIGLKAGYFIKNMLKYLLILFMTVSASCKKNHQELKTDSYYKPEIGDTFEWRLDSIQVNEVNQYTCDIIDIDAFSATKELVDAFHARGIKVIAYVSVGTIENYRPDSALIPPEVIGNIYPQWPDERFLNIREIEKLEPFITSRLNMIKQKGFDGIEPDNIDSYTADNGFNLTLNDAKKFCEWLIDKAHSMGLSIGQKNANELVPLLYKKFDWALTEGIFNSNTQNDFSPYISVKKPVFSAEYTDVMSIDYFNTHVCPKAKSLKYFAFLKHRDLTKWKYECQ